LSGVAGFSESTVEDAALDWLAELGWAVKHGPAAVGACIGIRYSYHSWYE